VSNFGFCLFKLFANAKFAILLVVAYRAPQVKPELISKQTISIPYHEKLTKKEIKKVIKFIHVNI
jgi:dTDP-4-amino-4,6-dideoxygalactose transaminase